MKRIAIAFILIFTLSLTGCSTGVAQEEYDALLLENELLRQELAAYTGEVYTPTPSTEDEDNFPENIADSLELETVEYVTDYWYHAHLIVKNTSDYIIEGVFSIKLLDSSKNIISTDNVQTYTIGPGESQFLFGIQEKQPFKPAYIEASVVSAGINSYVLGTIDDIKFNEYKSNDGIIIEATNNGDHAVAYLQADVLFYQGNKVVDYGSCYITDHENKIKPGSTLTEEIESYPAFDSYRVFYSGWY